MRRECHRIQVLMQKKEGLYEHRIELHVPFTSEDTKQNLTNTSMPVFLF